MRLQRKRWIRPENVQKWVNRFGWIGAAGLVVSIIGLGLAFYFNIQSVYNSVVPKVEELQKNVFEIRQESVDLEVAREIRELKKRIEHLENEEQRNAVERGPH